MKVRCGSAPTSCVFLAIVLFCGLLSTVSGGLIQTTKQNPVSLDFLQAKVKEFNKLELERISSKGPKRLGAGHARTLGMMDRVFESIGMNSITWVPGLRSLMDMNSNGTQMEFIPLGRLIWKRFFGDGATNTLLGF